jgi:uncharacterized protein
MSLEGKTIALSGASGLVGSALTKRAAQWGCSIVPLVRNRALANNNTVYWNYSEGELDARRLEGCDAVVHLAGESIASLRWSRAKMEKIKSSRIDSTAFLARRLSELSHPPGTFICASATGFYGSRGPDILDESSPAGDTFLAEVCKGWENSCSPLLDKNVRVVNLRIGMVLSPEGGALSAMLPIFRLGAGGRLGDGCQWNAWIHLHDLVNSIGFCLNNEKMHGAVNSVAPEAVTNLEFTRTLASILGRPALLPVPAILLRLLAARVADELLLASCRAIPRRLLDHGFAFEYPILEQSLRSILYH